jgi:hypothetical protein
MKQSSELWNLLASRRGLALVIAASAALMGCPNPNTYGTPRTTPAGQVAHTLAIEGIHIRGDARTTQTSGSSSTVITESKGYTFPMFPTYQLRVGLHDRVDLGFRVANLDSLGLDVKINFIKSQTFDLAFDPGIQAFYLASGDASVGVFYGHLPILAGINLGDNVTLVGSPGIVLVGVTASNTASSGSSSITSASGVLGRFGLGLNVRTSRRFAVHPEITAMKAFNDTGGLIIVFGIGLNFGAQPNYGPGSEDDKPEDEDGKPLAPAVAPATAPSAAPSSAPTPAPAPSNGTSI